MTEPNPSDDLRAVLLADFAAMRSEITTLLSLQGQFLSMSVLLLSIFVAASSRQELVAYLKPYLSMGAIPFLILGLLYADSSARIMRAARYINLTLRPALEKLTGPYPAWEDYIRKGPPGSKLTSALDYLRWVFFLGPAAYFTWFGFVDHQEWVPGSDLALIIFCGGVLLYVFGELSRKVVEL